MNVVPLVERPTWIDHTALEARRFDPLYYDPSLTIAERLYESGGKLTWKRLHEVTTDIYSFGAYELTNRIRFVEPGPNTVPFINVTEIGDLYVDIGQTRHIDAASHRLLHKSVCVPGTVLLSMSGSIGRVAVVPGCVKECNSNQHLAKIIVDEEKSDPYFIAAYFAASVGQASCNREAAGAVQKELYLYNISTLPVPHPSRSIRLAIGNKVQAAERLREEAELSRRILHTWLNSTLPEWEPPSEQMSVRPTFCCNFNSDRLDAWFNHPRFQELERFLANCEKLIALSDVASSTEERWSRASSEIEYIEIGEFDLSHGIVYGTVLKGDAAPSRAQILACRGDVAVSLVRLNRKNIAFIQGSGIRPIVVTSGCEVLRFANPETAALYSVVLRHDAVTYQLMRWNTGTNYPAIEQLRLDRIFVPAIAEGQRERLLTAAMMAVTGQERARALVAAAIADVEQLIEGDLEESQCLDAGRKLAEEFGLEKA